MKGGNKRSCHIFGGDFMLVEKERGSGRLRSLPGRRVWQQGAVGKGAWLIALRARWKSPWKIPAAQFQLSLLHSWQRLFWQFLGPFVERQAGFSDAHKSNSLRLGLRDSGERNSARLRAVPGHNFLWKDYKRLRRKSKRLIFHIHGMWK